MRYTNADILGQLSNIQSSAKALGLMAPEGERLGYERGSRVNGVAPGVWIVNDDRTRSHPHFIPRFTHKNTAREVWLMLNAVSEALFATMQHQRENK